MSIPARRALASAVLAATVTAGLVASGGAATAASTRVSDPVGDPFAFSADGTSGSRPGATQVDVTAVRLDYRKRFLVVVAQAQGAGAATRAFVRVKGGGEDTYFRSTRKGTVVRDDDGPTCDGGSSSFDAERATYRLRVPASCFGAPERVRLGFALSRSGDRGTSFVVDVAGRDGYSLAVDQVKLSKAVARG